MPSRWLVRFSRHARPPRRVSDICAGASLRRGSCPRGAPTVPSPTVRLRPSSALRVLEPRDGADEPGHAVGSTGGRSASLNHRARAPAMRGQTPTGLAACAALSCPAASSRGPAGDAGSGALTGACSSAGSPSAFSSPGLVPGRGRTSNVACCSQATGPDRLDDRMQAARFSETSVPRPSRDIARAFWG